MTDSASPGAAAKDVTSPLSIRGVGASLTLVLCAFAGFSLLLPVVPLAVVREGGPGALAGATTGVFMAVTVLVQLITPRFTGRFGYRPALVVGTLLLGPPSALLVAGDAPALWLGVSAVRGAGFGMMTVAGSALVAELAPPGLLGRATSLVGLAVGLAEMVFLPAGVGLYDRVGLAAVAWAAAGLGALGLTVAVRLPLVHPQAPPVGEGADHGGPGLRSALAVPFTVMLAVSIPYGAVSSFLSPALDELAAGTGATAAGLGLGLLGGAVVAGRAYAGHVSDRRGPGPLVVPGLVAAGLGLAGILGLLAAHASVWWFLVPSAVFGLGFGAVQNEALVASFLRVPRSRLGAASASWNISFDAGTGLGSLVLGLLAGPGYLVLFAAAVVSVVVLGGPAAASRRVWADRLAT